MKPKIITHEQVDLSEPHENGDRKPISYRVPDDKFNIFNIFKIGCKNVIDDKDYFCEDGWVYKLVNKDTHEGIRICQWGVRFNTGHNDQCNIKYARFADPNKFERYLRKLAQRKRRQILKIHEYMNDRLFLAMPFYAFKGEKKNVVVFESCDGSDSWNNKGKCKKSYSWRWISDDMNGQKAFETIKQDFNYKLDQELSDLYFRCDRYKMDGWATIGWLNNVFDYFVDSILECKYHPRSYNNVMKVIFNGKEYIYTTSKEQALVDFFGKPIVYDFRTKKGLVKNGN